MNIFSKLSVAAFLIPFVGNAVPVSFVAPSSFHNFFGNSTPTQSSLQFTSTVPNAPTIEPLIGESGPVYDIPANTIYTVLLDIGGDFTPVTRFSVDIDGNITYFPL